MTLLMQEWSKLKRTGISDISLSLYHPLPRPDPNGYMGITVDETLKLNRDGGAGLCMKLVQCIMSSGCKWLTGRGSFWFQGGELLRRASLLQCMLILCGAVWPRGCTHPVRLKHIHVSIGIIVHLLVDAADGLETEDGILILAQRLINATELWKIGRGRQTTLK